MEIRDFSQNKYFPGTDGNPFDVILGRFGEVQKIPVVVFFLILGLIPCLPVWISHPGWWVYWIFLWVVSLVDWLLLALLPVYQKSYGPPQPPVLILACLRALFAFFPAWFFLPAQIAGTVLVVYGFWIEPHNIRVTRQTLLTSKLPKGSRFTILHIGDLHIERVTQRELQLNHLVADLHPDLILFSGDFLNLSYLRDPAAWEAARTILSEWKAPLGVYAVTGSPAVDLPEAIPYLIKDLRIQLLDNQLVSLDIDGQPVDLIGIGCTHKPFEDHKRLADKPFDSSHLNLLLYHSPDLAPEAAAFPIDLQLAGHTHGGQVRVPFLGAIFTGSLYGRTFQAGRYDIGKMTLYITRGLGMEGKGAPRVRFLCPPELIQWTVTGTGESRV